MQIEQTQEIRDYRSTFADLLSDVLLTKREFFGQTAVSMSLFNRVQVFPLQIFDQRQLEDLSIRSLSHDDGGFFQRFDLVGRSPTSLSGDQFVFPLNLSNDERLDDSAFANRFDKLLQLLSGKSLSRL